MSNEINLLYSKKQAGSVKLLVKVRLLRLIAVGLLFTVAAISTVVFLLVLASPLPKLKEEENVLLESLSGDHTKIIRQVLINSRVRDISLIMKERSKTDEDIATLRELFPPGFLVKDFAVEKELITLSAEASTLEAIDSYSQSLLTLVEEKKLIKDVTIDSFAYNPGTLYQVSYTLTLL